jgi:hypothetical protein
MHTLPTAGYRLADLSPAAKGATPKASGTTLAMA